MRDMASDFDPIRKREMQWMTYDELVEYQCNKAAKANAEAAAQEDERRRRPQRQRTFGG